MSKGGQLKISRTRLIPRPNIYVQQLYGDFAPWCLDEEAAPQHKGLWRKLLGLPEDAPLCLEIGTGNGTHFLDLVRNNPNQGHLGIELKYKPLIQTVRRCVREHLQNFRVIRYNARLLADLFCAGELNTVYIYFPDPWSKKLSTHKHRLIQGDFLQALCQVQCPGAHIFFKTDSREYFDWSLELFQKSPYFLREISYDLHRDPNATPSFPTQFESIFVRQGLPIHWALLERPILQHSTQS